MTIRDYVYNLERENHELKKELETATEEIKRLESLLSKQLACFNYEIDGMLVLRDTEDRVEKAREIIKELRALVYDNLNCNSDNRRITRTSSID